MSSPLKAAAAEKLSRAGRCPAAGIASHGILCERPQARQT